MVKKKILPNENQLPQKKSCSNQSVLLPKITRNMSRKECNNEEETKCQGKKRKAEKPIERIETKQVHLSSSVRVTTLSFQKYEAKFVTPGGNSFLLSVNSQLENSRKRTLEQLRRELVTYLENYRTYFQTQFNTIDISSYIKLKKKDQVGTSLDEPDFEALSLLFDRNIRIYEKGESSFNLIREYLFSESKKRALCILYLGGVEYQPIKEKCEVSQTIIAPNRVEQRDCKEALEIKNKNLFIKRQKGQKYPKFDSASNLYNEILFFYQNEELPIRVQGTGKKFQDKRRKFKDQLKKYRYIENLDRIEGIFESNYEDLPDCSNKPKPRSEKLKCWYIIPLEHEIEEILKKIHSSNNTGHHIGRDAMITQFRRQGFNFSNLKARSLDIKKNCPLCLKPSKKKKEKPVKQIISYEPLERIQIDSITLASDLSQLGLKYLITAIDHFSKFAWCRAVRSINGESTLSFLEEIFGQNGHPKILHSDNGSEFCNKVVKEYLDKHDINFIHGRVKHPQSQGCIEKFNRRIQEDLSREYHQSKIDSNFKFKLIESITRCINAYNMQVSSTTKYPPIEAMQLQPRIDLECIDWIIQNTRKSFKNKNKKINFFIGEKVWFSNKTQKTSADFIYKVSTRQKLPNIHLPATIVDIKETYVVIAIDKTFNLAVGKVYKTEELKIASELINQTTYEIWNKLL